MSTPTTTAAPAAHTPPVTPKVTAVTPEATGHTAGPWFALPDNSICGSLNPQSGALYIAWANMSAAYRKPGENTANARLIASAPALLAALEGLLAVTENNYAFDGGKTTQAQRQARSAIAQAKGEA